MTTPEPAAGAPSNAGSPPTAARERISCPGCGRHDWVTWPEGQETYHWK